VFRLKLASNTTNDTKVWVDTADRTTTPPATATVNITCPATGIPSQTPYIIKQDEGIWPQMADNLEFPIFNMTAFNGDPAEFNGFGLSGGDGTPL
jgi:hypothetical protein